MPRRKPASRSAGTRFAPAAHFVRFTEAWNRRLHAAAAFEGKTIAGFLRDHATEAIRKAEEEQRAAEQERERRRRARASPAGKPRTVSDEVAAFGEAMKAGAARSGQGERQRVAERVAGGTARPAPTKEWTEDPLEDMLAALVRLVVEGPPDERRGRLRDALGYLAATTPDIDERARRAGMLRERIAQREAAAEPLQRTRVPDEIVRGLGLKPR